MKQILRLFALLFMVGIHADMAIAQGYAWESLSSADAIQVVRNFEGNPNLVVTLKDIYQCAPLSPQDYVFTQLYHMTTDRYDYSVSQYSHNRITRHDLLFDNKPAFYGQAYDDVALTQRMMTQQSALSIAQAFMQAHCPAATFLQQVNTTTTPNYGMNTQNTAVSTTFIESYLFVFNYIIEPLKGLKVKGFPTTAPVTCNVKVDTVNGDVIEYYQTWFPVLIPTTVPNLSAQQAMTIAMNSMLPLGTGVPGIYGPLYATFPDAMGAATLAQDVTFGSTASTLGGYIATIDMYTGAVLYTDILQGEVKPNKAIHLSMQDRHRAIEIKKQSAIGKLLAYKLNGHPTKLLYAPLLIANRPYLYAGYLAYGSPEAKLVRPSPDRVEIIGKERSVGFRLASRDYTLNGKQQRMAGVPVVINGAWYVPLEAARAALGSALTYDGASKAVCFNPPTAQVQTASTTAGRAVPTTKAVGNKP
jgi:hypothetical protein